MSIRCGACGSASNVQMVYDSLSEEGELRCQSCVNTRFPLGTRIVKFTDRSRPLRRAYYMSVETEDDLELILDVGKRARKIRAKGFEACFYTAHIREKHIGPMTFPLGRPESNIMLRGHVDKLRLWMETSKVLPRSKYKTETVPEIPYPLFAPINP
ncbi:MAG: hypothetical protein ACFFD9_04665 [Candidatus Thorarchaeota archaeon]